VSQNFDNFVRYPIRITQRALQLVQFVLFGQSLVPEQESYFFEVRVVGEIMDVVTLVN